MDAEWLAFELGQKPAIRRTVDPADAARVEAQLRSGGAVVLRAAQTAVLGGREQVVLYAARSAGHAGALRDAEEAVLPGRASAGDAAARHRAIGSLLGFPPCCVEAFLERLDRGVDRLDRGAWAPRADARINPLLMAARAQLISFYPCRYDCPVAVGVAEALRAALAARQPTTAQSLLALLSLDDDRALIARAAAPRRRDGASDPRDAALAARLAGLRVDAAGAITAGGADAAAPPWCVDFGG
jgi:hypothetical protein